MPNTRLSGTATSAAIMVSLIAETASGSVIAAQYTCSPFFSASTNTAASGTNRNRVRNTRASAIRLRRTQAGSVVDGVAGRRPSVTAALIAPASRASRPAGR
jgi:hypothetical protein